MRHANDLGSHRRPLVHLTGCQAANEVQVAAAPAAAAAKPGGGGTLTLLWWQAPTILNAHLSLATKDVGAVRIYAEPLADFNARGELVPVLAAEVPSVDNGGGG